MADRLVDGEPQVGRVDHEVVAARLDRRREGLLAQVVGQRGELRVPVPGACAPHGDGRAGEVLPAPTGRRRRRGHRLEGARDRVDGDRGHVALHPDPLLRRARAREVGVVHALLDRAQGGGGVRDRIVGVERGAAGGQHREALRLVHLERVDVVGGDPRPDVHRLRRQLHARGAQRRADPGECDGAVGQRPRGLRVDAVGRGEAPAAVDDDAHGESAVVVEHRSLESRVADPGVRREDRHDAHVGVARTELAGAGQRRVAAGVERQRQELGVDGARHEVAPSSRGSRTTFPVVRRARMSSCA